MEISLCQTPDIERLIQLYEEAGQWQREHSDFSWGSFEAQTLQQEIERRELYKIMVNGQIACVFKMILNDPVIWREKDNEPSVYLHRIAGGAAYRGAGFMKFLIAWAVDFCRQHNRHYIRLDTWGLNQKLTDYYLSVGFRLVGSKFISEADGLPPHYSGKLNLFEMAV